MPGSFTNVQRDHVLDVIFRGGSGSRVLLNINGDLKLALITSSLMPTASVAGSEVDGTGNGYVRQTLNSSNLSAVTGGQIKNSNSITFTDMPACTIVAVEVWDSSNIRLLWQTLVDPIVVEDGQNVVFAANALTFSLVSV